MAGKGSRRVKKSIEGTGHHARQDRKLVLQGFRLCAERGQVGAGAIAVRFLSQHLAARDRPALETLAGEGDFPVLQSERLFSHRQTLLPLAQVDIALRDFRRQGDAHVFQTRLACLNIGPGRLDCAVMATEQVEFSARVEPQIIEVESAGIAAA